MSWEAMNGLQTCSSFLDLTGNPVKCRSGPAAVRGANADTPLGRNLWEGGKSYEPKPEDLPVLRSPLASETFGRLHLRKTGRGSGDSRASVLAQHFRFFVPEFSSGLKTSPTASASQSARLSRTDFFIYKVLWSKGIAKKYNARIAPNKFS